MWGVKVNAKAKAGRVPTSADVKKDLWINLSQNVDRIGLGKPGALCTSGLWYTFQEDTVLDGQDALTLQGHPESLAKDVALTSSEKRILAGESYQLACVGAAMFSIYLNPWGSWWKPGGTREV
jgi:hypothetical protein